MAKTTKQNLNTKEVKKRQKKSFNVKLSRPQAEKLMSLCADRISLANREFYEKIAPLQAEIQQAFQTKTAIISEMSELIEIINNAISDHAEENTNTDSQTDKEN